MNEVELNKKQEKLEKWKSMVKECRSSGQTVVDWCKDNGVNIKTYYNRLKRLREYMSEDKTPEIVPVNNFREQENEEYKCQKQIKIQSGNINIELPHDIASELLISVIGALKC